MSKRRDPGDIVRRSPGSCFLGDTEPTIVRLSEPSDGELHGIDHCMLGCGDRDCREWGNVQVVSGPHAGEWLYHLSECQMEDLPSTT